MKLNPDENTNESAAELADASEATRQTELLSASARRVPSIAPRRHALLFTIAAGVAAILCIGALLGDRAASAELSMRQSRAAQVAADARAIAAMRVQPKQVRERDLPTADLLERVGSAMKAAELDPAALVSTQPQPARKIPGSDLTEVTYRLMFEATELSRFLRLCQELVRPDEKTGLRVAGLHLRAGADSARWNVDVTLGSWVYSAEKAVSAVRH